MSGLAGAAINPFVREGARVYFEDRAVLRSYVLLVAVLSCLLAFSWPRGPAAGLLLASAGLRALTVVAIGAFVAVAWISARCGAEDYACASFTRLEDYAVLTREPLLRAIAGKMLLAVLHTAFLLALASPFLLAALGVSAAPAGAFTRILLVIGAAAVAFRAFGLLLLVLLGSHALVRDVVMLSAGLLSIPASMALLPAASPVSAILALAGAADLPAAAGLAFLRVPFHAVSVILSLAAAAVFVAAAAARLAQLRWDGRRKHDGEAS